MPTITLIKTSPYLKNTNNQLVYTELIFDFNPISYPLNA